MSLQVLGEVVRSRRECMGLPQDLRAWGGPSDYTVRALEQVEGRSVPRAKTRRQLEDALRFPRGSLRGVLDGQSPARNALNETTSPTGLASFSDAELLAEIARRFARVTM